MKCFDREKYVLATLLDSDFKSKIETILLQGVDADNWKPVLQYIVVQNMSTSSSSPHFLSCTGQIHFREQSDLVSSWKQTNKQNPNLTLIWLQGVQRRHRASVSNYIKLQGKWHSSDFCGQSRLNLGWAHGCAVSAHVRAKLKPWKTQIWRIQTSVLSRAF